MNVIAKYLRSLEEEGINFQDVRIEQDRSIRVKTPVGWLTLEGDTPTLSDIQSMLMELDKDYRVFLEKDRQLDRSYTLSEKSRLRVIAFTLNAGTSLGMVIRRQDIKPIRLADADLPVHIDAIAKATSGLALVCGPTGSGKSTTIAAIVDQINASSSYHIVTIEQPIEYRLQPIQSVFTQLEVGIDVNSFGEGVRAALRMAPDVIVVGEIRDPDTCEAALRASMSGHLVLATTHSTRAVGAIQRMYSFFADEPQFVTVALQSSLIATVAQQLLPSIDGKTNVAVAEILNGRQLQVQEALGSPDKLNALESALKGGTLQQSNHFNNHLAQLVRAGRISRDRAVGASPDPKALLAELGASRQS